MTQWLACRSYIYLSVADEYAHSFELCESRGFGTLLNQNFRMQVHDELTTERPPPGVVTFWLFQKSELIYLRLQPLFCPFGCCSKCSEAEEAQEGLQCHELSHKYQPLETSEKVIMIQAGLAVRVTFSTVRAVSLNGQAVLNHILRRPTGAPRTDRDSYVHRVVN